MAGDSVDGEVTVRAFGPHLIADLELIKNLAGIATLAADGQFDGSQISDGVGDREDAALGPEAGGIEGLQRQVDELARDETWQALFGTQAIGGHIGGVVGDLFDAGEEADGLRHASAQELIESGQDVIDHRRGEAGVNADEEGVGGDQVGVVQVADNTVLDVLVGRVAQEVTTEQVAGFDTGGFQGADEVGAGQAGFRADGDHVAKPGGVGLVRGAMQDELVGVLPQAGGQAVVVALTGRDELRELAQLSAADGGLHVGDLEVVSDVAVNVFVVIAIRQRAELLAEALAAGVVFAAGAVAVAAPVAKAAGDAGEFVIGGDDRAALAHGDVVRGIKAEGGEMAEGAGVLAVIAAAEGVAVVFHQPEVVTVAYITQFGQLEGHAHSVGHHHRLGLRTDGGLDGLQGRDVGAELDIDEDGHGTVLDGGVDRGRKTGGDGDDFIARLDAAVAKLGAGEGGEGDQVGRGAGVDGEDVFGAEKLGQAGLEFLGEATGGEPEVEGGIDQGGQFVGVVDPAGVMDLVLARAEGALLRLAGGVEGFHQVADLLTQGVFVRRCDGHSASFQIFQGAWPLCQSFSRCSLSRRVSIGCQNPLWR